MMNGMAGGMWLGWLIGIALIALLIWAVVRVSGGAGPSQRDRTNDDALDILRRRLARGEIDEHEFEEKSKLLR